MTVAGANDSAHISSSLRACSICCAACAHSHERDHKQHMLSCLCKIYRAATCSEQQAAQQRRRSTPTLLVFCCSCCCCSCCSACLQELQGFSGCLVIFCAACCSVCLVHTPACTRTILDTATCTALLLSCRSLRGGVCRAQPQARRCRASGRMTVVRVQAALLGTAS
jgi:hypothetical protein